MSRSDKFFDDSIEMGDAEFLDHHDYDNSLPSAVRSLENEELQALLVALLSEWRKRTAMRVYA